MAARGEPGNRIPAIPLAAPAQVQVQTRQSALGTPTIADYRVAHFVCGIGERHLDREARVELVLDNRHPIAGGALLPVGRGVAEELLVGVRQSRSGCGGLGGVVGAHCDAAIEEQFRYLLYLRGRARAIQACWHERVVEVVLERALLWDALHGDLVGAGCRWRVAEVVDDHAHGRGGTACWETVRHPGVVWASLIPQSPYQRTDRRRHRRSRHGVWRSQ